jgi:hypothetical protein
MKLLSLLLVGPCLFYSVFATAETQRNFSRGNILFEMKKHYRFEMKVDKNTKDSLNLYSTKVFKKAEYSYKPTRITDKASPYYNFRHTEPGEETEDDTVSLHLYLSDFYKYNDSHWFRKSLLQFREKFVPYSNAANMMNLALHRAKVTDKNTRDTLLKRTVWLTSEYALSKPYNDVDVESKVFNQVTRTSNHINEWERSQNLSIEAENFSFFARGNAKSLNAKSLDSFYFGNTHHSLTRNMYNSLWKNDDVNYSYLMLMLTNVLPVKVSRYSEDLSMVQDIRRKWPAYDNIENPNTGDEDLKCVRNSKTSFTCYYSIVNNVLLTMPSSTELESNHYPAFIINALKKNKVSHEEFEEGVKGVDLNSLKHFNN